MLMNSSFIDLFVHQRRLTQIVSLFIKFCKATFPSLHSGCGARILLPLLLQRVVLQREYIPMKIALCQLNALVGDIRGNAAQICETLHATAEKGVDLLVFPELFIQGYPPRDLLEQKWFIQNSLAAVDAICKSSEQYPETGILFGTALPSSVPHGKGLYNTAVLVHGGKIVFHQKKSLLPTYDVFDESRYFDPASGVSSFPFKDEILGVSICEDVWNDEEFWPERMYDRDPLAELAQSGVTLFVNIAASPFHLGKEHIRFSMMKNHARKHRLPFVFVNQVGGNDELIFDGNSMFLDSEGNLRSQLPAFKEAITVVDTQNPGALLSVPDHDRIGSVHDALVLGIRDYARKCGFRDVLLGLSGGIDSAVTAVLAARALGPEHVRGVTMPSRHSSEGSVMDSKKLAENLGIEFRNIPIEQPFSSFLETLEPEFVDTESGVAEENLQARIRGTLLMALSNKFGHLLLSTGNKSEMAVGYSTLYGDMNGGLCAIADLPKGMVYKLADFINREREVIPSSILTKPPSAELRPGQKDQDTLPPYPILDAILEKLIEQGKSSQEVISEGFDKDTVTWIARAIAINEYKRRQAPTGLKVTPKAFGSGRRLPIAAKYEW